MTRRKPRLVQYTPLELAQYRLRMIANALETGKTLDAEALRFLVDALWAIGQGQDANKVLGVIAYRGERKTSEQAAKSLNRDLAMAWITKAVTPVSDGGLGMTEDEAIEKAAKNKKGQINFGLSEDSLRSHWKSSQKLQSGEVKRPIQSFPDRKKKD